MARKILVRRNELYVPALVLAQKSLYGPAELAIVEGWMASKFDVMPWEEEKPALFIKFLDSREILEVEQECWILDRCDERRRLLEHLKQKASKNHGFMWRSDLLRINKKFVEWQSAHGYENVREGLER